MTKINNLIDVINAGIKAETLRNKAIANNIANLQTPGYRRVDVKFKELLEKAMGDGEVKLDDIDAQVFNPMTTAVNSQGNDVSLEHEVGQMVKNNLRHKAYTRFLQKKYQQIDLAITVK